MQAKNGVVIGTIIVMGILVVLAIGLMIPNVPEITMPTNEGIAEAVLAQVTIPTAADIAAELDLPDTKLSLQQELKADAVALCDAELDMDEIEDLFGNDDEVVLIKEYEDDRTYTNIKVGLDNEDDREITIKRIYKVEVEPDLADDYKDKVYVKCKVESDDGVLEADLTYNK